MRQGPDTDDAVIIPETISIGGPFVHAGGKKLADRGGVQSRNCANGLFQAASVSYHSRTSVENYRARRRHSKRQKLLW